MSNKKLDYRVEDLDAKGAVKASMSMYLVALFLTRQLFYAPLSLIAKRKGRGGSGGGSDMDLSFLFVTSVWEFVACIPGALMLFLLLKNKSEAGAKITSLWMRGQLIYLLGLVMQIAATVLPFILYGREPTVVAIVLAVAYLYVGLFLLRSPRIKDVFSAVPGNK